MIIKSMSRVRRCQKVVSTVDHHVTMSLQAGDSVSDYGYASQRSQLVIPEMQENVSSTSSNDEDSVTTKRDVTPHTNLQKPRPKKTMISSAEMRELRRKKLIKRAKSQRMKMKSLVHHIPTDEDIADLLKEFTVDFILKGYSTLVRKINLQLLCGNTVFYS